MQVIRNCIPGRANAPPLSRGGPSGMTPAPSRRTHRGLETPSGKGAGDENFPVGSFLIRPALRPHVHALYRFARAADDIADNPALAADDKVARLARMAEIIDGRVPQAAAWADSPWNVYSTETRPVP